MKKKLSFIFIFLCIIFASISASAKVTILYQNETTQTISGGLTQENFRFLTNNGWVSANAIVADMSNKNLSFTPLFSNNGLQNLSTVKNTVSSNNALAGVNGDFFAWATDVGSGLGSSINTVITNSQLASSSANSSALASFAQYQDGTLGANLITTNIYLHSSTKTHLIGSLNKFSDLTTPAVYTDAWGSNFTSVYDGMFKILVNSSGVVYARSNDQGTLPIPPGGFILVYGWNDNDTFSYINVGDKLTLEMTATPNLSTISSAIGGGTYLLNNGAETSITSNPSDTASGRNPRTGIGTDSTGTKLYLVTVDGRSNTSIGATLPEFAGIMQRIGVWTGINLDGGGSTQMADKDTDGNVSVVNTPSENRAVANVAGVVSNGLKGTLSEVRIEPERDTVTLGDIFSYKLIALDNYGNILHTETDLCGTENVGVKTITATYQGITGTAQVLVLDSSTGTDTQNVQAQGANEVYNIFGTKPKPITVADNLIQQKAKQKMSSLSNVISQDFTGNRVELKGTSAFIYLDNSGGGLGTAGWQFLNTTCLNTVADNYFFIMNTPLGGGGFKDSQELNAFYDTLQQNLLTKGKNVYIFSSYQDSVEKRDNGIRYITASSPQNTTKETATSVYSNYQYIEVSVKNGTVTWVQKNIE